MNGEIDTGQTSALDELVAELLDAAGIVAPPVDAFQLADAMRIPVARDARQSGRARLARLRTATGEPQRSCILLNEEPRPERRQWAVAHEIGEHLAPELFHRLGLDPREGPDAREVVANAFATRLLLPSDWFSCQGEIVEWDLLQLKQEFSTASHELIARRMLDFGDTVVVSVFDRGRLTWRRSNTAARRPPLSKQEAGCQRQAHDSGEVACQQLAEATIRAWPIHEPDWKREIVRTEVHCIF